MKKLLLLAAALFFAVACGNPEKPGAETETPELSKTALTLNFTKSETLTVNNYTGKVIWASDNEYSARVTDAGEVTAFAVGTASVSATLADGKVFKCTVTVEALHKAASFTAPVMDWYADTITVKSKETRAYLGADEMLDNNVKVGFDLNYREGYEGDTYYTLFTYSVRNVADEDGKTGLVQSQVLAIFDAADEAMGKRFFNSFGERHLFLGRTSDEPSASYIFMNKEKTYSIIVTLYSLSEDKSVLGWAFDHIPFTNWTTSAPEQTIQIPAGLNIQPSNDLKRVSNVNALTKFDYAK